MRPVIVRATAAALAAGLLLWLLGGGCSKEEPSGTPLLKVADTTITREMVDHAFLGLPQEEQVKYLDRAGRRQLVDNLVTVELLYQEALRQNLDREPRVRLKLDGARRQILVDELINRSIMPADLYRMFQDRFIKVRSLIIELPETPSEAVQARARAAAEKLYSELSQGAKWEEVARKKLAGPLLLHDQDWGYMNRDWLGQEVGFEAEEATFSLKKPGEFTRPLRLASGYIISQVQETSGNLNPEGYTRELAEYLLNEKKEEVYRSYVTDLRTRRQKDIQPNTANLEDFLSLGDRAAAPEEPEPAAGASAQAGDTSALPAE